MWSWYANHYVVPRIEKNKISYDGDYALPLELKTNGSVLSVLQNYNISSGNGCERVHVLTKTGTQSLCMICKNGIVKSVTPGRMTCRFEPENKLGSKFGWTDEAICEVVLSSIEVPIYLLLKNFDTPINRVDDSKIEFDINLILQNIKNIRKSNEFYYDHREDICMNYFATRTLSPRHDSRERWSDKYNRLCVKIDRLMNDYDKTAIQEMILKFEI